MLAHAVYFETLASINDETAPAWQSTVAGLVVLRLIDDWLDAGAHIVTTDITGLRAIRETTSAVSEGDPIRSILHGLVDALEQAETASITVLTPHLLAYGRALHFGGQWRLAKDVFANLVKRAEDIADAETSVAAAIRLGFITRRIGELDESDAAYTLAEETSHRIGNVEGELTARLGCAQNIIVRGNLPQADELIGEIVAAAEQHYITKVLADALHDRAHVRHLRKDYSSAIRFGYSALEFTDEAHVKERILADMAASFAEMGYLSAARDAHLIVTATTQDAWVRHQALLNLMEIAVWEEQEPTFHQYRQILSEAVFTPEIQTYFHLYSGRGYRVFGNPEKASVEFEQAIQLASTHGLNQLRMEAEEEVGKVAPPVISQPTQEWAAELKDIATAIGNMRQLVEVGAKEIGAPG